MYTEESNSPPISSNSKAIQLTDHLSSEHDLLHVLVFLFKSRPCPSSLPPPSFHLFSPHRLAQISAEYPSPSPSHFDHRKVIECQHLDFEASRLGIWLD